MDTNDWRCPACNTNVNSTGGILVSSWAVACHLAVKIRTGDNTHRIWARTNVSDFTFDSNTLSIELAEGLEEKIIEKNHQRIKTEQVRVQQIIDQMNENEEPDITAYRHIKRLENELHTCVKVVLQQAFGKEEKEWWFKGIPYKTRCSCATKREQDSAREEIHKYTDFSDLKKIIEYKRRFFNLHFSNIKSLVQNDKEFLANLDKSNEIRRKVMHAIRDPVTPDDAHFIGDFCNVVIAFVGRKDS